MRAIKTQWFNILKSVVLVRVVENMSRGIGLGFHTFLSLLPKLQLETFPPGLMSGWAGLFSADP